MALTSTDQLTRYDVIFARKDDETGRTYYTHTGWRMTRLAGQDGEMWEPVDLVTGDIQDSGEKKVNGSIIIDRPFTDQVHGGGHGLIPRSA